MAELTSTRNVEVPSTRTIGSLIAIGLLAATLVGVGVMLRPTVGTPAAVNAPAFQAPTRDDYGLRQLAAVNGADDYGLRHSTPAIVGTTSRMDDYGIRHQTSAAAAAQSDRSTDFGLRHSSWNISSQSGTERDDYGLRH